MAFGSGSGSSLKKFVTQEEVDETRRRRQEEWEKKRTPDQPLECPEEDTRSLFEQLQEQKDKQQQEYDEQHRLRNSIKGLEEDEVHFLDFVSQRQVELEKERAKEEASIFKEMRDAAATAVDKPKADGDKKTQQTNPNTSTSRKSQQALLMGAVKRKSSDTREDAKKTSVQEHNSSSAESSDDGKIQERQGNTSLSTSQPTGGIARVLGVLPGIGAYSTEQSTDSDSSSSDSDLDDLFSQPVVKKIQVQVQQSHGS